MNQTTKDYISVTAAIIGGWLLSLLAALVIIGVVFGGLYLLVTLTGEFFLLALMALGISVLLIFAIKDVISDIRREVRRRQRDREWAE